MNKVARLARMTNRLASVLSKSLATNGYLSALGTAVEAHLGTILPGPRDAGSLPVKPTTRPQSNWSGILLLA
jgi:hypothetical protein